MSLLDKKRLVGVFFIFVGAFFLLVLLPEFETFELKTLDYRFRLRGQTAESTEIVLVTIDDETIEALGYPLSRDFHAAVIKILSEAGAKVIAFDILFTDPDRHNPKYDAFLAAMTEEAGNVCHAVGFKLSVSKSNIEAEEMLSPLPELLETAKSIGHINIIPDSDGVIRKIPLVIRYKNKPYLYLGCQMAADYLKIPQEKIRMGKGEVILGEIHIPVNRRGELLVNYGGEDRFKNYSFLEVLQSFKAKEEKKHPSINLADFKDKLVLVGVSASGTSDIGATPFTPVATLLETHAHVANNILKEDFLKKASKGQNLIIPLLFCLMTGIFLFYSRPSKSPFIFFISLSVYTLFSFLVFKFAGIWIDLVRPGLVLFFSFVGFVSYQLLTEKKRILEILEREVPSLEALIELMMSIKNLIKRRFSKELTFLNIDVVDATAIKEGEEDYNINYSFSEYYRLLGRIVEKNNGKILNISGDGALCRFQKAEQAVNAAIEFKNALISFNENINILKKPILVRMGINSGKLLLDSSAEGGKVFSRTIDIAGHLQKEASPNEILISEETFRRLKDSSFFEEKGYLEKDKVKMYRYTELKR